MIRFVNADLCAQCSSLSKFENFRCQRRVTDGMTFKLLSERMKREQTLLNVWELRSSLVKPGFCYIVSSFQRLGPLRQGS